MLWLHAARRAYETGNLDQLAKLFCSVVPHSPQLDQMLVDIFGLCKLIRKNKGAQRKLFGMSAAQNALAEHIVRCLMSGEFKLSGELSADEVLKLGLRMDDKSAHGQDAKARKLGKLRESKGHMPRLDQMLADIFGLCKLIRKNKGGQRKLFGMSAATQKALAEHCAALNERRTQAYQRAVHQRAVHQRAGVAGPVG
jgi:hypothetical protein